MTSRKTIRRIMKVVAAMVAHQGRPVRLWRDMRASTVQPGKENHRCVSPITGKSATAVKALMASCEWRSVSSGVSGFIRTRSPSVASEREWMVGVEARSAAAVETSTAADAVGADAASTAGVGSTGVVGAAEAEDPTAEVEGRASEGTAATGVAPTACSTAAASATGEGAGALWLQGIHDRCRIEVAVAAEGPIGRFPNATADG